MRFYYPKLRNMTQSLLNVFIGFKGTYCFLFYLLLLQLVTGFKGTYFYILFAITAAGVVPCLPVHHPSCRVYCTFGPFAKVCA